ncbi:MAG: hypothetical protein A2275_10880 [Bacteroidetes bacterium RIFOXYA12_FULL_35_11]|nr:MAG: hypothetical protein A2X01_08530 [Bacteroidetes bacterium GWF2_35_48]OFY74596.1 MAG: hypothetical protein A2275_10880 [Bacteroidetes bacterium RIFOXYA12_FULL_35_11]OFY95993.1 MAG: hypothetical protein A2491_07385 [Bacteroidetes bacterium RIFOXYC12_FULL_35_7]
MYFVISFILLFPSDAYAYLDPGTGSYIMQLLIAFVLGGLFAIKLYWKKVKDLILKIFRLIKKNDK